MLTPSSTFALPHQQVAKAVHHYLVGFLGIDQTRFFGLQGAKHSSHGGGVAASSEQRVCNLLYSKSNSDSAECALCSAEGHILVSKQVCSASSWLQPRPHRPHEIVLCCSPGRHAVHPRACAVSILRRRSNAFAFIFTRRPADMLTRCPRGTASCSLHLHPRCVSSGCKPSRWNSTLCALRSLNCTPSCQAPLLLLMPLPLQSIPCMLSRTCRATQHAQTAELARLDGRQSRTKC